MFFLAWFDRAPRAMSTLLWSMGVRLCTTTRIVHNFAFFFLQFGCEKQMPFLYSSPFRNSSEAEEALMSRTLSPRRGAGVLTGGLLLLAACSGTIGETTHGSSGNGFDSHRRRRGRAGRRGGYCRLQPTEPRADLHPQAQSVRVQQHHSRSARRYHAPRDDFPSEEKRLGFDNNAAGLQISPVLAEQYMLGREARPPPRYQNVSCAWLRSGQGWRRRVRQVVHLFVRSQGVSSPARRR